MICGVLSDGEEKESGAHLKNQSPAMKENTFKTRQLLDGVCFVWLDELLQTSMNK